MISEKQRNFVFDAIVSIQENEKKKLFFSPIL